MESSDAPQSLRALFETAESKRRALEGGSGSVPYDPNSSAYKSDLETTISLYTKTLEQISAVSLFSPNEGIEDIATSELPFLLTSFHLAELIQRTPTPEPRERPAVLRRATRAYELFLNLVDAYGLIPSPSPYSKLLDRYREEGERFAVVAQGADASARRNGKIASFKAEKQLKERMETLRRNPGYLEARGGGDEELVRELHLTNVTFAVHKTFDSIDSMNRELDLLLTRAAEDDGEEASYREEAARRRGRRGELGAGEDDGGADSTLRLDQPLRQRIGGGGPLLSKAGKPLQPFTLLGSNTSRSELARGVFRPGHNLPTMSIDEYLEEEKRRGNILQGGEEPRPVVDEDDFEAADREMYKAREWDEFKDNNPRGSGNTMNMG